MEKNVRITKPRDIKRAATIQDTAELVEVSTRQVRRVLDGEQENPKIISVFMELQEGKNLLLQEVKNLIPFI